jgi:ABC-type bacteriocin/lantibiotic exporter with double-glycine peptidase domain
VSRVFQTILVNGVYIVLVPPFLMLLNWRLAMLSLLSTPVTVGVSLATGRIIRRQMKQTAEASSELGAIQVEALSQIRTLKPMAVEYAVFRDAREQVDDVLRTQLRVAGLSSVVGIVNAAVRAVTTAMFTWYAWTLILAGDLSLGSFFAFSAYLGYLTGPVSALAGLFTDFQQMSVSFGRAFEYLDLPAEQDPSNAYVLPGPITKKIRGEISFDSVSFGYTPDQLVLHDVSVSFSPGTITAVVGLSGAGKSSLLRLLCRLADPTTGAVRIDGMAIGQLSLSELRRQVGVVWQEPTMLRGTIWQNLTIGLDDVTTAEVDEAIRACQLDDVIAHLPLRYETPVAEWGASVSGGQRQRFAIARALLRRTPVLLLDEATSQVDVRTEEALLRDLFPRVREKTVVFVTHRLATAALADRVVVMEGGRVIGEGLHQELSRIHPAYRAMLAAAEVGEGNHRMRRLGVT